MKLRFYIGLLIMIETIIVGCIWLMGYDLTIKEKIKIMIGTNVFVGLLSFGIYLML